MQQCNAASHITEGHTEAPVLTDVCLIVNSNIIQDNSRDWSFW